MLPTQQLKETKSWPTGKAWINLTDVMMKEKKIDESRVYIVSSNMTFKSTEEIDGRIEIIIFVAIWQRLVFDCETAQVGLIGARDDLI